MESLNENFKIYQAHIQPVQKAYRGIIQYLMGLKHHVKRTRPEYAVADHFYQGYMDRSFFTLHPRVLKQQKLKIWVGLNHSAGQFEIGLVGHNRSVQKKYRTLFSTLDGVPYPMYQSDSEGIIWSILVEQPNFDDLEGLTQQIESGVDAFVQQVITVLEQ